MVTSGRRAHSAGAQVSRPEVYMTSGFSGRCPTGWHSTPATTRSGVRSISLSTKGPPIAHKEELADAEVVHQAQLVVGEGAPGVLDRDRPRGFSAVRVALVHRDAA